MDYDKTQYGTLMNVLFGVMLLFLTYLYMYQIGNDPVPFYVFLLISASLLAVSAMFYKLRIRVDQLGIHIIYGIGLIHIKINPEIIESVEIVRNPWYYGLGIRVTRKGMLYNINGADAIELKYIQKGKSKTVRIGSNDCASLQQTLKFVYKIN